VVELPRGWNRILVSFPIVFINERERERERERPKVSTQRKSVSCGAFILVHVVVVVTNASAVTREYRKRDFPVFGGSKMRHKTTTTLVKFSHLNAPLQRPYRLVLHR
jgi:hypothetical protein